MGPFLLPFLGIGVATWLLGADKNQPPPPPQQRGPLARMASISPEVRAAITEPSRSGTAFKPAQRAVILAGLGQKTLKLLGEDARSKMYEVVDMIPGWDSASSVVAAAGQRGLVALGSLSFAVKGSQQILLFVNRADAASASGPASQFAILAEPVLASAVQPQGPKPSVQQASRFDAALPEEIRADVLGALADVNAKTVGLRAMATEMRPSFPLAASALSARADMLDMKRRLAGIREGTIAPAIVVEAAVVEAPESGAAGVGQSTTAGVTTLKTNGVAAYTAPEVAIEPKHTEA